MKIPSSRKRCDTQMGLLFLSCSSLMAAAFAPRSRNVIVNNPNTHDSESPPIARAFIADSIMDPMRPSSPPPNLYGRKTRESRELRSSVSSDSNSNPTVTVVDYARTVATSADDVLANLVQEWLEMPEDLNVMSGESSETSNGFFASPSPPLEISPPSSNSAFSEASLSAPNPDNTRPNLTPNWAEMNGSMQSNKAPTETPTTSTYANLAMEWANMNKEQGNEEPLQVVSAAEVPSPLSTTSLSDLAVPSSASVYANLASEWANMNKSEREDQVVPVPVPVVAPPAPPSPSVLPFIHETTVTAVDDATTDSPAASAYANLASEWASMNTAHHNEGTSVVAIPAPAPWTPPPPVSMPPPITVAPSPDASSSSVYANLASEWANANKPQDEATATVAIPTPVSPTVNLPTPLPAHEPPVAVPVPIPASSSSAYANLASEWSSMNKARDEGPSSSAIPAPSPVSIPTPIVVQKEPPVAGSAAPVPDASSVYASLASAWANANKSQDEATATVSIPAQAFPSTLSTPLHVDEPPPPVAVAGPTPAASSSVYANLASEWSSMNKARDDIPSSASIPAPSPALIPTPIIQKEPPLSVSTAPVPDASWSAYANLASEWANANKAQDETTTTVAIPTSVAPSVKLPTPLPVSEPSLQVAVPIPAASSSVYTHLASEWSSINKAQDETISTVAIPATVSPPKVHTSATAATPTPPQTSAPKLIPLPVDIPVSNPVVSSEKIVDIASESSDAMKTNIPPISVPSFPPAQLPSMLPDQVIDIDNQNELQGMQQRHPVSTQYDDARSKLNSRWWATAAQQRPMDGTRSDMLASDRGTANPALQTGVRQTSSGPPPPRLQSSRKSRNPFNSIVRTRSSQRTLNVDSRRPPAQARNGSQRRTMGRAVPLQAMQGVPTYNSWRDPGDVLNHRFQEPDRSSPRRVRQMQQRPSQQEQMIGLSPSLLRRHELRNEATDVPPNWWKAASSKASIDDCNSLVSHLNQEEFADDMLLVAGQALRQAHPASWTVQNTRACKVGPTGLMLLAWVVGPRGEQNSLNLYIPFAQAASSFGEMRRGVVQLISDAHGR